MPSPFPGMDPYLENPHQWPDTRSRLINALSDLLVAQLRPNYFVRIEHRLYVSDESDPGREIMFPDLRIGKRTQRTRGRRVESRRTEVAVVEPIIRNVLLEEEIHEARLRVFDSESRQVVTVLEVLSPANKVPGARGRESYLEKRREILNSSSNFVEIDLLRGGTPVVAPHLVPPHDYLVHVSRAVRRPLSELWPINLRQQLPVIGVPLHEGDSDAKLDLQEALTLVYDRAAYELDIDYDTDPIPPLMAEAAAWADELLTTKGLRRARPRKRRKR